MSTDIAEPVVSEEPVVSDKSDEPGPYSIRVVELLKFEEGEKLVPYHDTEGFVTVGIGHKLSNKKYDDLSKFAQITKSESEDYLIADLKNVDRLIKGAIPSLYYSLNYDRKVILQSMVFQMGISGVMKFEKALTAMNEKRYGLAADEMLDSKWAAQTPRRAERHAFVMRQGNLMNVYGQRV